MCYEHFDLTDRQEEQRLEYIMWGALYEGDLASKDAGFKQSLSWTVKLKQIMLFFYTVPILWNAVGPSDHQLVYAFKKSVYRDIKKLCTISVIHVV